MRTLTKKEKAYLDSLVNKINDAEIKAYILADFDTQLDIVEQELDEEDTLYLVSSAISRGQTPSMTESFPGLSYKNKAFHADCPVCRFVFGRKNQQDMN